MSFTFSVGAFRFARAQRQALLDVQGERPAQAFAAVGANVLSEQGQQCALIRTQHVQAGKREDGGEAAQARQHGLETAQREDGK
ncbi:hypothetical protein ACHMW6_11640 [Pseudoduganella sp. UC29_106]|uniref:hypothetical protein n=1 Tax=Pseudoduganella sp. UC29_106 TaxID=3374553 RepID=UPI003757AC74